MAKVVEVPETETMVVGLPTKIRIEYEFTNPFKSEKETPSKLTINVEIFLTKDEAKILEESITDKMIEILNMIFEARKLEQNINTLDVDPA